MPELRVLQFLVPCYIDDVYLSETNRVLAVFQWLPVAITIFHATIGLWVADVFFMFANTVTSLLLFFYLDALARSVRSERPALYDWERCGTTQFALPDAWFVTSWSYCIVIGVGLFYTRSLTRRIGMLSRIALLSLPPLYTISLVVNAYFTWRQALCNLLIAAAYSTLFLLFYRYVLGTYNLLPEWRAWVVRKTGIDNAILTDYPCYAREHQHHHSRWQQPPPPPPPQQSR